MRFRKVPSTASNLCPEILHSQVNHFTSHSPLFTLVFHSCHNHISQLFIN